MWHLMVVLTDSSLVIGDTEHLPFSLLSNSPALIGQVITILHGLGWSLLTGFSILYSVRKCSLRWSLSASNASLLPTGQSPCY